LRRQLGVISREGVSAAETAVAKPPPSSSCRARYTKSDRDDKKLGKDRDDKKQGRDREKEKERRAGDHRDKKEHNKDHGKKEHDKSVIIADGSSKRLSY
jgi:hypothetical protein